MQVTAYTHGSGSHVLLGDIAESVWVDGLKSSETRALQIGRPVLAAAPNIFDRNTRVQNFSFAAGRTFDGGTAVAQALAFVAAHPGTVPAVADLQFRAQGGEIWLNYCGIEKVELIEKKSALVVFSYTIVGGTWAKKRT